MLDEGDAVKCPGCVCRRAALLALLLPLVPRELRADPPPGSMLGPSHEWWVSVFPPTDPSHTGPGCCAEADGRVLGPGEYRFVGTRTKGHREVWLPNAFPRPRWWPVDPEGELVADHESHPSGRAVAWYSDNGYLTCFVPPAAGG